MDDGSNTVFNFHDLMGADLLAHTAASAFFFQKFKGCHTFKVIVHAAPPLVANRAITHRIIPMEAAVIWNGTAPLISFFTPDREV